MSGRISFIGAGPGAADLITVRAARRIAEADVVVWSASVLAPECVREHAAADVELIDSSQLNHEQAVEVYRRAERDKLRVVRLHAGDPALWGAVQQQYDACTRMDLEVEIVPGVAGFTAAAAAVGRELTAPESAQSVVLTRLGGTTPESEQVREFARHGTTMAVTLPASRAGHFVEELRAGGYSDDVPVLVAYKVSLPDELLVRTTIGELEQAVKSRKLWRNALFLVGKALDSGKRADSGYRRGDPSARRRSYRPSGSRRRGARPEADPEDLPQQRAVGDASDAPVRDSAEQGRAGAVPNIAWWAVREWQEAARGSARVASRSRRAEDPGQSDLFGSQRNTDATEEPEPADEPARPALSLVRSEAELPAAAEESAVEDQDAASSAEQVSETQEQQARESAEPETVDASEVTTGSEAGSGATGEPEVSDDAQVSSGAETSSGSEDSSEPDTPAGASSTANGTRTTAKTRSRSTKSTKSQSKTPAKSSGRSRSTGTKSAKRKNDSAD
ncbi:SAM-dependent methyltransferase [Saccharopolyspora sp. SCSIO 74807]|uniref:cobalt-precorrin-4/precorrin-4 C(11)-methyltransferase n=1 Tax=Saccharopolyspora sp. SCSIO 74807 TaxID=3118084 RepID=UPI0030D3584A